MSMSPGVTYRPETSTTFNASAAAIAGATAATLPFAMATSRTALMRLRGSMRWPPLRSRSYFCCGGACRAGMGMAAAITRHTAAAYVALTLIVSASPVIVALRGPLRGQVLAHVECARHRVACDGAGKTEAQRV